MNGPRDPAETGSADLDATRRRLSQFVSSEAYRPDLLARIARISAELRDPVQAGRYWFLSDAAGPGIDAAVDAFVKSCQSMPRLIASELPRFSGDWDVDGYAPAAKERIGRFGLSDALAMRRPGGPPRRSGLLAALRRIFGRGRDTPVTGRRHHPCKCLRPRSESASRRGARSTTISTSGSTPISTAARVTAAGPWARRARSSSPGSRSPGAS